jgi:hypothetical protein
MSAWYRKETALERRLKELDRELSAVRGDLRSVSRGRPARTMPESGYELPPVERPGADSGPGWQQTALGLFRGRRDRKQPELFPPDSGLRPSDERFVDYLSSRFGAAPSLRHERDIQRNKAIAMLVCVAILLIWLVLRYLL